MTLYDGNPPVIQLPRTAVLTLDILHGKHRACFALRAVRLFSLFSWDLSGVGTPVRSAYLQLATPMETVLLHCIAGIVFHDSSARIGERSSSLPSQLGRNWYRHDRGVLNDANIVRKRLGASGKRCTVANEPAVSEATWSHELLESELASALESGQFFLVYQPTIDLQTNAFAGVEVLIRWRHPQRGVVGPESFISQLETSGQIVPVGRWALASACTQGAIWHDRGYRFAVSVNISSKQLEFPEFAHDVARALSSSRFDPALLVLEFSQESLLGDEEATMLSLADLKSLGVRLAVDDFAPGETPLADLAKFPIDIVKLDKGFIAGITNSPEATALIHTLVQLAKALDVQIIASGIEDAEQRRRLAVEEVNIGQGFHFSKPREAQEIDRYLEDFAIFSGRPL